MSKFSSTETRPRRRAILTGALLTLLTVFSPQAISKDLSGEIVMINWLSGVDLELIHALEAGFMKAEPKVKFREIALTVQGDQRGAIRTSLMGGEKADLLINSWPAFRTELANAGQLRPLDQAWTDGKWSDNLGDSWRNLSKSNNVTYGVPFLFSDRSGLFYRTDTLKKAGLSKPPATWTEFLDSFKKLKAANITPIPVAAKVWAHGEWFETLLLRTGGVEASEKLAAHKIPWTDPIVKTAMKKFAEMIKAGCCGSPNEMLATDWDNAADQTLKAGTHAYDLIGMWVNLRAKGDYGMAEGKDYGLFQFPALGMGHDDTSSVDTKEFVALKSGSNPKAADAFLGWVVGQDAANILAKLGQSSPSKKTDTSLFGPVLATAATAVYSSKVQFVLGDLLPGDLVDEYRVQLQHFLRDPSDANIDKVLAAIEAKAKESYK